MTYKMIQIGTGGWGKAWCEQFLSPNIKDGLIEVIAAVDVNRQALTHAQTFLGLRADQCYTNLEQALAENRADFCAIVVPPMYHEAIVDLALAYDLDILCEKPAADTLEGAVRIAGKVRAAGKKMAVTMSHRFDQDKTTLRHVLRSGKHGRLDYLVCHFSCDCRQLGTHPLFRHETPDMLLIEGAVHHLDILADLAGVECGSIYAQAWTPPWGAYVGGSQALMTMHFPNSTRAFYEGASTNAVGLNGWSREYIRVECEEATLILQHRRLECFPYNPAHRWTEKRQGEGVAIPLLEQPKWANTWLIEKFAHWLDGGEPLETNIEANLQSMALVFAAIESSHSGQAVKVQDLLNSVRD